MSGLQEDAVKSLLMQLETQYNESAKGLNMVRQQISTAERQVKLSTLTLREIRSLPDNDNIHFYEGVGKMFVQQPRATIEESRESQSKAVEQSLVALQKKSKYLEKEMASAQGSLRDILRK